LPQSRPIFLETGAIKGILARGFSTALRLGFQEFQHRQRILCAWSAPALLPLGDVLQIYAEQPCHRLVGLFAFPRGTSENNCSPKKSKAPLNSALSSPIIATIMPKNLLWPCVRKRRSEAPAELASLFSFWTVREKSWKTKASTSKPHRPTSRAGFYL
jgi:hypothetical protein